MDIQLIEKHENIYRLSIDGVRCDFIPPELFVNSIMPVKKCYCNGSLVWYVNRKRVSYWQVNYPPTAEPMGWASGINTPTNVGNSPRFLSLRSTDK